MPIVNVDLGSNVQIAHPSLVNIYGCKIGDETKDRSVRRNSERGCGRRAKQNFIA